MQRQRGIVLSRKDWRGWIPRFLFLSLLLCSLFAFLRNLPDSPHLGASHGQNLRQLIGSRMHTQSQVSNPGQQSALQQGEAGTGRLEVARTGDLALSQSAQDKPVSVGGERQSAIQEPVCTEEERRQPPWPPLPEPEGKEPSWKEPPLSEGVRELIEAARESTRRFCQVAQECHRDLTNGTFRVASSVAQFSSGTDVRRVDMFVLPPPDVVSDSIIMQGSWEREWGDEILSLFRQRANGSPVDERGLPVTFLDIGANVGWFSFLIASAGFRVFSFEAMKRNAQIMMSTLCMNPYLAKRVTLVANALGNATRHGCFMSSHVINGGNGNICCGDPATYVYPEGHVFREWLPDIVRLDDYLAEQAHTILVVKMDVEGYEEIVISGGERTFLRSNIPYIVMEFALEGLERHKADPLAHLQRIQDAGYTLSLSLHGSPVQPKDVAYTRDIINIWCIHKTVQGHHRGD